MAHQIPYLRMTNAHVLREGQIARGDIVVQDGLLLDDGGQSPDVDLSGYYVLPGIIDLHGDAFEHHIAPRPTAPLPQLMALASTDRDAAASGITTAWMAQSWSWEGGRRGPDYAESFLAAHALYAREMLTDLRVQLRCETHTMDSEARLIRAVNTYGIDYVIFNNHLQEAIDMAQSHSERVAEWAARAGRTAQEHIELVRATLARSKEVPRYLCNLASCFDKAGVRYGSHDDEDAETRERFSMIGAKICEFPTTINAASAAKAWGDPVLMGAPNVVRGGSQVGNISAAQLIREGLCSALVSDYYYPTLARAAFRLVDDGVLPLPRAWALVSSGPAQIMGLADRGVIAPGRRADLAIINMATRTVEGTMANGAWSYLAAGLAHRFFEARSSGAMAAE